MMPATRTAAREPGAVPKPLVKSGDWWSYRRTDLSGKRASYQFDVAVTFAKGDAIYGLMTRDGKADDATWTSEWNQVTRADGSVIPSSSRIFRFPLESGSRYAAQYELLRHRYGTLRRAGVESRIQVSGWEEVVVPAGSFRALKVVAMGEYRRADLILHGDLTDTFWYVPDIKRWVKYTHQERNRHGVVSDYVDELVEFHIQ